MPASATITTYHTFSPNTKARSSEMNTNLLNHRGHTIPINTDTASSSNNTHDLGAVEHRWRVGYVGEVNILSMTSTAALTIKSNIAQTNGGFVIYAGTTTAKFLDFGTNALDILLAGSTLASLHSGELRISGSTATTSLRIVSALSDTGGGMDVLAGSTNYLFRFNQSFINLFISGTTIASWNTVGMDGSKIQTATVSRVALGPRTLHQSAANTGSLSFNTATTTTITALVVTVTTYHVSDIVEICLGSANTNVGSFISAPTHTAGNIDINFLRGAATVRTIDIGGTHCPESVRIIDSPGTVGSTTYCITAKTYLGAVTFEYVTLLGRVL